MKILIKINLLLIATLLLNTTVKGQVNLSADEIIMQSYKAFKYAGDDVIATANMDIRNEDGESVLERELIIIRKNVPGSLKQKWYSYFKKPADIRKMVFMVWKNLDKDDDRWLFLPAMDLVKRLSGADKRSSFAGGQFYYEDVTGRNPSLDTHEIVNTKGEYIEIKSTPIKTSVEFSYYLSYIDKDNHIPMQRVYFDKSGEKHRVYKSEKVETIQGFPSASEMSMTDVQSGESTFIRMMNINYNVGIKDNLFTEAQIRRTPREWLQYGKK